MWTCVSNIKLWLFWKVSLFFFLVLPTHVIFCLSQVSDLRIFFLYWEVSFFFFVCNDDVSHGGKHAGWQGVSLYWLITGCRNWPAAFANRTRVWRISWPATSQVASSATSGESRQRKWETCCGKGDSPCLGHLKHTAVLAWILRIRLVPLAAQHRTLWEVALACRSPAFTDRSTTAGAFHDILSVVLFVLFF